MVYRETPAAHVLRARWVTVVYERVPHRLNVTALEVAFLRRVVEGRYDSRAGLAATVGVSRSTVSRFMRGRSSSLRTALRILAELEVQFDDVAVPCGEADVGSDR